MTTNTAKTATTNRATKTRTIPLELVKRAAQAIREACDMMEPYHFQCGAAFSLHQVAEELELYLPFSFTESRSERICPDCGAEFRLINATIQHGQAKHGWDRAKEEAFIASTKPKTTRYKTKAEYLAKNRK